MEDLLELATGLAHEAGDVLLAYAEERTGDRLAVQTKTSATDPVSEADRASERHITAGLLAARPDDGILGEEDAANRTGTTGIRWIVDPLDGTVNYLYGIPAWCVSIAAWDDDGGLVGIVHDPSRRETFTAVRGQGAAVNGHALHVSQPEDLSQALVATGFAYGPDVRRHQGRWAQDLLGRARDLRRVGAAALDLAWTAAGRFDGFYEFGLAPWDFSAGVVIVEEAGGRWSRQPVTAAGHEDFCTFAGSPAIHDRLVDWLAEQVAGAR